MRALPSPARFVVAGLVLGSIEVGLVLATRRELFLSPMELLRYALLALSALPALCVVLGVMASLGIERLRRGPGGANAFVRRLRHSVFALSAPACAAAFWLLSAGRRVRAVPGRALWVALLALAAAYTLSAFAAALIRVRARVAPLQRGPLLGLLWVAASAVAIDMHVLTRLYPVFHLGLGVVAVGAVLCATLFEPAARFERRRSPALSWPAALALGVLALLADVSLSNAPNARFAIAQSAPLSGRFLLRRTVQRMPAKSRVSATPGAPATAGHAGIDLRGRDVLMITVDALRADRLRAYGGHGLTPAIDALAAESVVFDHAYTPTPHTSYALSSLMTAKFMQPLLSLSEIKDEHPTLPQLLRNHGYRTAAFYPPAIFFVDGERFAWLRKEQLGFEYVKAMYAPAAERVPQLEQYLREVAPGHPLFVWMHLFEPHEPYDPLPQYKHGDTPVERYDGEVAAADAAVGQLVAAFRRARPSATVILSADHGEEFGDHGGHHHGTTLFEEQVHVPALWSSPGVAPPHHVQAPIEILDLTTTLLAALGIPREARMRGDDLSGLLAGGPAPDDMRAFASIDGARMFTDGRLKLICSEDDCRLFDLLRDPSERRDVSDEQIGDAARLHGELDEFVASLPRLEALAMAGGGAWPNALARARLGDAAAGPELMPLLAATRADVRAASARALGELGTRVARDALALLRTRDADPDVRAEAAVAALRLGDAEAREQVLALLPAEAAAPTNLARRAAVALALAGDTRGQAVLLATALDASLDEPERVAAIRALASAGASDASTALLPLLEHVRLRNEVADALARLNDRSVAPALQRALQQERYPESRRAEARALLALGARAPAVAAIRRFLGTSSSIPDGVLLLREASALADAGGADLRSARVRRGRWQCEARGCAPLAGAALALPAAAKGAMRVVVRVQVEGTSRRLRIGEQSLYVNAGATEVAFALAHAPKTPLAVSADPGVWLDAFAAVPVSEDVPPPAPEPWSEAAVGADTPLLKTAN